jgi:uncharacterized membrane protein
MSEQQTSTANSVPWLLYPLGRALTSILIGALCFVSAAWLPRETRIIVSIDLLLLTFVVLVFRLMTIATAEVCAGLAKGRRSLTRDATLVALSLVPLVGMIAISALLNSQNDKAHWVRMLHLGGSLFAVFVGWISAQMIFGIQYMRIYYNNLQDGGAHLGARDLNFPGQLPPDLWDFMYFSFSVAMTYGATDVTISGREIRRLTLVHAIYSFFFVATIIGFVVSVLTTIE